MNGNPLREWRQRRGLTEPEVAKKLHVKRATVNKWELGKAYPRAPVFRAIAELMGMRIGTLAEKWAKWQDQETISVKP